MSGCEECRLYKTRFRVSAGRYEGPGVVLRIGTMGRL